MKTGMTMQRFSCGPRSSQDRNVSMGLKHAPDWVSSAPGQRRNLAVKKFHLRMSSERVELLLQDNA